MCMTNPAKEVTRKGVVLAADLIISLQIMLNFAYISQKICFINVSATFVFLGVLYS